MEFHQDFEGTELASVEDAYEEAISCARDLVAQHVIGATSFATKSIEITDHDGAYVGSVALPSVLS